MGDWRERRLGVSWGRNGLEGGGLSPLSPLTPLSWGGQFRRV